VQQRNITHCSRKRFQGMRLLGIKRFEAWSRVPIARECASRRPLRIGRGQACRPCRSQAAPGPESCRSRRTRAGGLPWVSQCQEPRCRRWRKTQEETCRMQAPSSRTKPVMPMPYWSGRAWKLQRQHPSCAADHGASIARLR
jgi:hypothetical protein